MTSKEKELLAGLITLLIIFPRHFLNLYRDYRAGLLNQPEALGHACVDLLWAIGIAVVVQISVVIALHIVEAIVRNGEVDDAPQDERDRLIELRGDGWFNWLAIFGMFAGLLWLARDGAPAVGVNFIVAGWVVSTSASAVAQLFMLRRGV